MSKAETEVVPKSRTSPYSPDLRCLLPNGEDYCDFKGSFSGLIQSLRERV